MKLIAFVEIRSAALLVIATIVVIAAANMIQVSCDEPPQVECAGLKSNSLECRTCCKFNGQVRAPNLRGVAECQCKSRD